MDCDAGHQHAGGDRNDIMSAKEKEATSKTAFTFLAPLASEQPAKQIIKRDSAGSGDKMKKSDEAPSVRILAGGVLLYNDII